MKLPKLPKIKFLKDKKKLEFVLLLLIPILIVVSTIVIVISMVWLFKDNQRNVGAAEVTDSYIDTSLIDTGNSSGYVVESGALKASSVSHFYGDGSDGDIIVSSTSNINTDQLISGRNASCPDASNYSVTALTADTASISEDLTSHISLGCIVAGDEMLLINLMGVTGYTGNLGNYEIVEIDSLNGGVGTSSITFTSNKTNYYGDNITDDTGIGITNSDQRVMIQRLPEYDDVTVNSGISFYPSTFNEVKGGVLAFKATGTVTVTGRIHANSKGYLGSDYASTAYTAESHAGHGAFFTNSLDGEGAGYSGGYIDGGDGTFSGGGGGTRSVSGAETNGGDGSTISGSTGGGGGGSVYRKGSAASGYGGGGGGGGHATGGEGGGGLADGETGSALSSGAGSKGDATTVTYGGGGGGGSTIGIADLSLLTMGGGGGSGGAGMRHTDSSYWTGGLGNDGSGIIFITADVINVVGSIESDGIDGGTPEGSAVYGGGGGGGAGGSIKLVGDDITLGSGLVSANGGVGNVAGNRDGGNGGEGRIRVEYETSISGTTSPSASQVQLPGYSDSSVVQSLDLISGDTLAAIESFEYNLSSLPGNSTATLELSTDGSNWETAQPGYSGPGGLYDFGDGSDGAITVLSDSNINTDNLIPTRNGACPDAPNYNVTALTSNTATVTPAPNVANGCLAAGDKILIINLSGTSDSAVNLGKYETLEVDGISGSTITFTTNKDNYYGDGSSDDTDLGTDVSNQRVMIQRIPEYTNVTVNSGMTFYPSTWDGQKGGVMAFRASGDVVVTGSISTTGIGYRGGEGSLHWVDRAIPGEGGFFDSVTAGLGGGDPLNGEDGTFSGGGGGSRHVGGTEYPGGAGSSSDGAIGGGGGGSEFRLGSSYDGLGGGGGGGGHSDPGGAGMGCVSAGIGTESSSGAGGDGDVCTYAVGGGGGGGASYGESDLSLLTMGGAGGGGGGGMKKAYNSCENSNCCQGGDGGDGGGIIYISADSVSVTGTIESDASLGTDAVCWVGGDGGGGAGGSIRIIGDTLSLGSDLVTVSGTTGDQTGDRAGGDGSDGYLVTTDVEVSGTNEFELTTGVDNTIDLTGFGWETTSLYYRITYDTDSGAGTPVLDDITIGYNAAPGSPTIGTPQPLSTSSIRWNFTDNSTNEVGYKLYAGDDSLISTNETENLSYIDETSLSPNTEYTRKVLSYNGLGSSDYSSTATIYTLVGVPTIDTSDVTLSTMTFSLGNEANLTSGTSGIYVDCSGAGCDTGLNEWIQTTSDTVTGLSPNTSYTFIAKARNGDSVETANSGNLQKFTLIEEPTISLGDITTSSIDLSASGSSNFASGSSGLYFDCVGSSCDTGLNSWIQSDGDIVTGLSPNTEYGFQVKARNGDTVETGYSDSVLIYTYANVPGAPTKDDSTPQTLDLTIDVNSNPSITEFAMQETSSGKYVNKDSGLLEVAPDWGTYSDFVSGGISRVTGLSAGTLYQFKLKARNGNNVETEFGSSIGAKTKVVITNIPEDLDVQLQSDDSTDLTTDGVDAESYDLRLKSGDVWIADVPIDLNENRDFSSIVAEEDSENSKAVVKVTGTEGFSTGTFDMYVIKGETDYVRVCPDADNLNLVTDTCTNGVDFEGPFPQTQTIGAQSVRVITGTVGDEDYWKVEGLTGTGVLGLETPICGDGILGNTEGEECELDNPSGVSCSWAECIQESCICPEVTECGDGEFNVEGEECELGDPSGYDCTWSECNQTTCTCPESVSEEDEPSAPEATTSQDEEFVADDGMEPSTPEATTSQDELIPEDELEVVGEETQVVSQNQPQGIIQNIVNTIVEATEEVVDVVTETVTEFAEENEDVAGTLSATPVITSATAVAVSSGVTFSDIPYRIMQFVMGILQSVGIVKKKKEKKNWGVVYNSITKEPITNAVVRLFTDGLLVGTEVTDLSGSFSFSPKRGSYEMKVSRSKFVFPSDIVTGKTDLLRTNVYRGEKFRLVRDNQDLSYSIPLDPHSDSPSISYLKLVGMYISSIVIMLNPVFLLVGVGLSLGLYSATGNILNLVILMVYVIVLGSQVVSSLGKRTTWGVVKDDKGKRLAGIKIGIYDKKYKKLIDVRVTDSRGRYRFLLPKDEYVLKTYKSDYKLFGKDKIGVEVNKKGKGVFFVSRRLTVKK